MSIQTYRHICIWWFNSILILHTFPYILWCSQVLSNANYKSVEHRVAVNSANERVSLAFFYNPKSDIPIEPVKELVTEESPSLYPPMTFDEYRLFIRTRGPKGKSQVESMKSPRWMTTTIGINYKYFSKSFFCFHVLNSPVNHIEIVQPFVGYVKNIHHVIIKGMGFLLSQKYIENENIIYNI